MKKHYKSGISRIHNPYVDMNKRYHIDAIMNAEEEKLKFKNKPKPNNDTLIRQNVYSTIITMLNEGKTKVEILTQLLNKYPDFPGNIHFSTQIDDQIRKREIRDKKTSDIVR